MVEKVITPGPNVVDFARYQLGRTGKALAISVRICRHCGAALLEGEREDECSGAFTIEAPSACSGPRKFYAD
jgi:hypothetical protein